MLHATIYQPQRSKLSLVTNNDQSLRYLVSDSFCPRKVVITPSQPLPFQKSRVLREGDNNQGRNIPAATQYVGKHRARLLRVRRGPACRLRCFAPVRPAVLPCPRAR